MAQCPGTQTEAGGGGGHTLIIEQLTLYFWHYVSIQIILCDFNVKMIFITNIKITSIDELTERDLIGDLT